MNVRIITTKHCPKCKAYLDRLNQQQFNYQIYDADDPDNQNQLDEWGILDMPVVQLVDNQKILFQFAPGTFSPRAINHKISTISKE